MAAPVRDPSREVDSSSPKIIDAAKDTVKQYRALPHREHNHTGQSTIIFIHGAFDNSTSWDIVTPHLPQASD